MSGNVRAAATIGAMVLGEYLEAYFEPAFDERVFGEYSRIITEKGGILLGFEENGMAAFFPNGQNSKCKEAVEQLRGTAFTEPAASSAVVRSLPGRFRFSIIGADSRMAVRCDGRVIRRSAGEI